MTPKQNMISQTFLNFLHLHKLDTWTSRPDLNLPGGLQLRNGIRVMPPTNAGEPVFFAGTKINANTGSQENNLKAYSLDVNRATDKWTEQPDLDLGSASEWQPSGKWALAAVPRAALKCVQP